jgi:hypothetical protein
MTLLNAPEFDVQTENRKHNLLVGSGILVVVLALFAFAGFALGHGWFFMNFPVEHKVSVFLSTIEAGDYTKAYGIFNNDPDWQQHPQKYADYPLQRFTEDFSTASDWKGPVRSFKVNCSKRDATGTAVDSTVNGGTDLMLKYQRADGTLSFFPLQLTCGI